MFAFGGVQLSTALDSSRQPDITHQTLPVSLILSDNHVEYIDLYDFEASSISLVLGHPWISKHNTQIEWKRN